MAALQLHMSDDMLPVGEPRTMSQLIKEDHDVLIRLSGTVESMGTILARLDKRDEDFERRLRWLERAVFGAGGGGMVIFFLVKVVFGK